MSLILLEATSHGTDNTLTRIIALVEDAQMNKAPIQTYADKISHYFVPVVLFIAFITFITWNIVLSQSYVKHMQWYEQNEGFFFFSLMTSISVIVVSCPCALGLATPTAVMVGTGLREITFNY